LKTLLLVTTLRPVHISLQALFYCTKISESFCVCAGQHCNLGLRLNAHVVAGPCSAICECYSFEQTN